VVESKRKKEKNGGPQAVQKEECLEMLDSSILQQLVGEKDCNLKLIEKELDLRIGRDEKGLVICGQDTEVDLAFDLLRQLSDLLVQGESIFPGDVERALKLLSSNRRLQLKELFRDQIKIAGRTHTIVPRSFRQREYIEAIREHDVVVAVGPAGTGKTYLAMTMAVSALLEKRVKRVVLCRPAVEAGEKLGFLPGDMAEKVNPYLRPLYDALHDMVDYERAREMVEKGQVEVAPLAFMRGRTLSKAFVVLDEAQNATQIQMKMFLTRLGPHSKCVITGDLTQIDLPRGHESGLEDTVRRLRGIEGISIIHFGNEDVMRHKLVAKIVSAYEEEEEEEDA